MTTTATGADDALRTAAARLRGALVTGGDPLLGTAYLLEVIALSALGFGGCGRPTADDAEDTKSLLHAVMPLVVEAIGESVSQDRVCFGLGAAAALLASGEDRFRNDRALYAGFLANELRAAVYRAEIARRGDPLFRAAFARYAWEAAPTDPTVH